MRTSMDSYFAAQFVSGIDANRTLKDEVLEAMGRQRGRRRLSVTDLVNPRQAYFRWTRPDIQPSLERLQVMLSGTGFHEVFGRAISTEEYLEQTVEFEGIVGKIDIFQDVPTELKTSGSIPRDVKAFRPGYIDQLGMYCAMTGKPEGRLVIYKRAQFGRSPELKAFDVTFTNVPAVAAEMRRRRDLLRQALDNRDPTLLPRCEWFSVGCDYREICGCERAAPLDRLVSREGSQLAENAALASSLADQLSRGQSRPASFSLNDLVFPRKAAFERKRTEDPEAVQEESFEARLAGLERAGFKGALYQTLRYGIPGAFARIPVQLGTLHGMVSTFKGIPTLLRSTRMPRMVDRSYLAETFSHYFDRLAFECALSRHAQGRIVIYYEALSGDKFMIYDVWLKDLDRVCAEAERRLALLESGASPYELPACPSWMAKFCNFAARCKCGANTTSAG